MTAYAVTNGQGQLVSIGTILPSPLPAGLTANPISDTDFAAIRDGYKAWVSGSVVDTTKAVSEANATAIADAYVSDMAKLQAVIDSADPGAGTLTTAVLSNAVRQLAAAAKDLARCERHIYRYLRGDFTGTT